jgi:hypothetical protein
MRICSQFGRYKKFIWPCFGALFCLAWPNCCLPNPIAYQLVNVTFGDGGMAMGSFIYDIDTNTFSSVDITTSSASGIFGPLGSTYTSPYPGPYGCCGFAFVPNIALGNFTETPVLSLGTVSAVLTDAGGSFQIQGFEGVCANANCFSGIEERLITSGSIASVPEPSTRVVLLVLALAFFLPHSRRVPTGHWSRPFPYRSLPSGL